MEAVDVEQTHWVEPVVSVSRSSSSLCSSTLRGSVSAAASIIPTVPLGDVSRSYVLPPPA
jgi:hypothetical protein